MHLLASIEPEPRLRNGLSRVRSTEDRTILASVDAKVRPTQMRSSPLPLDHLTAGFLDAGFCSAVRVTSLNCRLSLQLRSGTARELRYRIGASGAKRQSCHRRWRPRFGDRSF